MWQAIGQAVKKVGSAVKSAKGGSKGGSAAPEGGLLKMPQLPSSVNAKRAAETQALDRQRENQTTDSNQVPTKWL